MKRYVLLRNNRESGPFSGAELKAVGLVPTDLVWVEGESTAWLHPSDLPELATLVTDNPKSQLPDRPVTYPTDTATRDELLQYRNALAQAHYTTADDEEAFLLTASEPKGSLRNRRKSLDTGFVPGPGLFGAVVLLIGGALMALFVAKLSEQLAVPEAPVSQAVEIKSETLPPSVSSHAAQSGSPEPQPVNASSAAQDTLNAAAFAAQKALPAAAANKVAKKAVKKDTAAAEKTAIVPAESNTENNETVRAEEPKPESVAARPPMPDVTANEYKVGLFGGISNLEISVRNPSSQKIGKAVVEIDFLKPNGSVVKTQTVKVEDLSPGSSKTLAVPASNRGTKVRWRVVSAE